VQEASALNQFKGVGLPARSNVNGIGVTGEHQEAVTRAEHAGGIHVWPARCDFMPFWLKAKLAQCFSDEDGNILLVWKHRVDTDKRAQDVQEVGHVNLQAIVGHLALLRVPYAAYRQQPMGWYASRIAR